MPSEGFRRHFLRGFRRRAGLEAEHFRCRVSVAQTACRRRHALSQGGRDAVYCGISWVVTFLMFKTPFSAMPLEIGIGLMPSETPAGQSIAFRSFRRAAAMV
ncbi:hypothetical protein [Neisseria bergeri]|uniref:hypothetical protein n=1 Tax=Neisseria bergeri TaxID=1906581 RepID=UPI00272A16D7|nr:hypothetical protein [Neisseria bergeri]